METEECLMKQTEKNGITGNSTILAAFPEQEVSGSCKVSRLPGLTQMWKLQLHSFVIMMLQLLGENGERNDKHEVNDTGRDSGDNCDDL